MLTKMNKSFNHFLKVLFKILQPALTKLINLTFGYSNICVIYLLKVCNKYYSTKLLSLHNYLNFGIIN